MEETFFYISYISVQNSCSGTENLPSDSSAVYTAQLPICFDQ